MAIHYIITHINLLLLGLVFFFKIIIIIICKLFMLNYIYVIYLSTFSSLFNEQ